MHDHTKEKNHAHEHSHDHSHASCCGHDHNHEHEHHHEHDHSHKHHQSHAAHGHDHGHGHEHNHDHSCCDHDHGHHTHLSSHDCSALVNTAQKSTHLAEATQLLLQAGSGFAHLNDATGTAAVVGLLHEKKSAGAQLTHLQSAQLKAISAISQALNKNANKDELSKCIDELENFSGEERKQVEQLLGDVRKTLAGMRNQGLKSLLSKLKF